MTTGERPGDIIIEPDLPAPSPPELRAVTIGELLSLELPPRVDLLSPWMQAQGLGMIYAPRGVGKTHLALGIGYAVASGGAILRWRAPEPRGVLYIDGEMPARVMQERLATIVASSPISPAAPLRIITPDIQAGGMPDLSTVAGQGAVDAHISDDVGLVIVDNLSTLIRSGKENEAESWLPVQGWALRHRAAGRSILFVHHAGKGGAQRGTSRREDVLDSVIALRRPVEYNASDGAVFEVIFEKARGIHGDDVTPFEARLEADAAGNLVWTTRDLADCTADRILGLQREGLSQAEIARELNVNRSTVCRHLKHARGRGEIG